MAYYLLFANLTKPIETILTEHFHSNWMQITELIICPPLKYNVNDILAATHICLMYRKSATSDFWIMGFNQFQYMKDYLAIKDLQLIY